MSEKTISKENIKNLHRKFPWRTVIILCAAVYAIITFFDQKSQLDAADKLNRELTEQEAAVTEELEYLERKENFVDTDEYVEQSVRDRLGWIGDDELIFYSNTQGNE